MSEAEEHTLTALPAYPQPALRVTATYHAPAAGCPESVDIEVNYDTDITPEFIREVVHALVTMPGEWDRVDVTDRLAALPAAQPREEATA